MTEQAIQKEIVKLLEEDYNAYVVKVQVASKSGVPDLLVCIEGMFLGIEVKRPTSKHTTTRLQEYNLDKIEKAGGKAMVAWNAEMVKEMVDEYFI